VGDDDCERPVGRLASAVARGRRGDWRAANGRTGYLGFLGLAVWVGRDGEWERETALWPVGRPVSNSRV
jgi:hypothetical protein